MFKKNSAILKINRNMPEENNFNLKGILPSVYISFKLILYSVY